MRAFTLAVVVLSALALNASHPILAADRTVQVEAGDADRTPAFSERLVQWLEFVLTGSVDPVTLTLASLTAQEDEEASPKESVDEFEEADRDGVILEDGAPF